MTTQGNSPVTLKPCPFCAKDVEPALPSPTSVPFVHHPPYDRRCPLSDKFFTVDAWNARLSSNDVLVDALRPFGTFAETFVDDEGWTGPMRSTRIVDWFGPSQFRAVIQALASIQGAPVRDGEAVAIRRVCDQSGCTVMVPHHHDKKEPWRISLATPPTTDVIEAGERARELLAWSREQETHYSASELHWPESIVLRAIEAALSPQALASIQGAPVRDGEAAGIDRAFLRQQILADPDIETEATPPTTDVIDAISLVAQFERDLARAGERPNNGGSLGFGIRAEEQTPLAKALRTVLAALSPSPVEADAFERAADETGWLIEQHMIDIVYVALSDEAWPRFNVVWHGTRTDTDEYRSPIRFVQDASEALRFARKDDAEAFVRLFARFMVNPIVAEHSWPAIRNLKGEKA